MNVNEQENKNETDTGQSEFSAGLDANIRIG